MILMDIGAVIFIAALMGLILELFTKRREGVYLLYTILSLIGGILMIVAYYIVLGNESIFDKVI